MLRVLISDVVIIYQYYNSLSNETFGADVWTLAVLLVNIAESYKVSNAMQVHVRG